MATLYQFHLQPINAAKQEDQILIKSPQEKIIRQAPDLDGAPQTISLLVKNNLTDTELEEIKKELSAQNVKVITETHEAMQLASEPKPEEKKKKKKKKTSVNSHWVQGGIGTAWGVGMLVLSLFSGGIPIIAMYVLSGLSTLLTLVLGFDSYRSAFRKLFHDKKITMDTLFTISTLTIIGVSIASFFVPWLPIMVEGAPLLFGLRHLGKAVEDSMKTKVLSGLKMRARATKKVKLMRDNEEEAFAADELIPNDIITIYPGEIIPVDGVALNEASLFTTNITGSPSPSLFRPNNPVLAGSKVAEHSGPIKIRVKHTEQHSYLARVDENLKNAHKEKAEIEHVTQKLLQYFVPALLLAAVTSGVLIGIFFNPALAIQCAISVLVSACPCALGFITPLAVKIGMSKAAEKGINFKSGKTLQAARDINTIVFDVNGTLTTGKPVVTGFKKYSDKYSEEDCLRILSLLEEQSDHPVAKNIVNYARLKGITASNKKITVNKINNHGLTAVIDDDEWFVGNEKILELRGIPVPKNKGGVANKIYLVKNNEIIATVKLEDPLRPDAYATVRELQRLGYNIHLCSGNLQKVAERVAEKLHIPKTNVVGDCSTMDIENSTQMSKPRYVQQLKAQGYKVAMVGDGINDSVAIAESHFGIAIRSEASDDEALRKAGAAIPGTALLPIVAGFEIAKQAGRNIVQNLSVSLLYNSSITLIAGGLLVAIGFSLNPALGIALMVLETSLVLANTYRFKRQSLPYMEHASKGPKAPPGDDGSTYKQLGQYDVLSSPTISRSPSITRNVVPFTAKPRAAIFANTEREEQGHAHEGKKPEFKSACCK